MSDSGSPIEEIPLEVESDTVVVEKLSICEGPSVMPDGSDSAMIEAEPEAAARPEPESSTWLPEQPTNTEPNEHTENTAPLLTDVSQPARASSHRDSFHISLESPSLSLPGLSPFAPSQVFDSPSSCSYVPPLPALHRTGSTSSVRRSDLPFTDREAYLLRHYIEQLSPWVCWQCGKIFVKRRMFAN